jgi:hypothetical protein
MYCNNRNDYNTRNCRDNINIPILICTSITSLFLILLLVPLSFSRVAYYEIGLIKSRSTGIVNRNIVYQAGNHYIGPDNYFVIYPASIQTKLFEKLSIWSRASSEDAGIFLEIDISFQWKLDPDSIGLLYNKIGTNWNTLVSNLAISAIKNEAVKWSADEYLVKRRLIEKNMFTSVSDILIDQANCNVTSLQLRDINFPVSFYERKLESAIQMQKNIAEAYNSSANIIRGETSQLVQYINNKAVQAIKFAESQAVNIKSLAETRATKVLQDARITGLTLIKKELGLTNTSHLMSLDYMLQLEQNKDKIEYLVNFDKTALLTK